MRTWKIVLGAVLVLLVVIQFIPSRHPGNPPVQAEVVVPDEVMGVIETSCYDCHSHETEWPWYASVAPMKWLVRHDVAEGREHLNFSAFADYEADEQVDKWDEVAEEVAEGNMPLWYYTPLHGEARLTDEEREILVGWAELQAQAGGGETEASETAERGEEGH